MSTKMVVQRFSVVCAAAGGRGRVGSSVLVDGAKRDRTVWPGDYGIAIPTDFASINDMASVRNGLTTQYQHQDPSGAMPYTGPEINLPGETSDTYSMRSLVATADYYLDTADKSWLDRIWPQYKDAVRSTGPTGALTYDVLRIEPTSPGGESYQVIPHPVDLSWVDGRLAMPAGAVVVSWRHTDSGFALSVADHGPGTGGVIAVPRFRSDWVVDVNGAEAWDGTHFLGAPWIASADQDGTYIYFRGVQPGIRTFEWSARS